MYLGDNKMETAGLCDICGKASSGFTCSLCGRRVCKDDITVRGVCRRCAGDHAEYDKRLVDKILKEKGLDEILR
jgi:hypothetical protein